MQKNIIIGAVAVVIVGGVAFYAMQNPGTVAPVTTTTTTTTTQTPVTTAPVVSTTKAPVVKTAVTTTKAPVAKPIGVNATISKVTIGTVLGTSGAVSGASATFAPTTKTIYAGLAVKNVTVRTQLSYVRYFNGKYVDSKVSHPSKDGVAYFHFAWTLVSGQTRKPGNYALTFYVNGKKAQTATYTIK